MINSTVRSDILVFNCYLRHVKFLLTCYVCSTKIGENSDISKCFENFVSQALGFLKRFYAAELRIYNYADEIPHILIRVINAITLSENEEELRSAVSKIAEETKLDKFFAYGYGAHHFWLTHRKLSNGEPKEYRLLKVEF